MPDMPCTTLRTMETLPTEVYKHFRAHEHTMHHTPGLFNGIWSDMALETTYMRYGHGCKGIVGITLKPESLKTWAYSLHTCNRLINGLNEIRDEEGLPPHTYHKEEMPSRIKADTEGIEILREKLELNIDPLDPEQHQEGLVNVVMGKVVCHSSVNVNNIPSWWGKTVGQRVSMILFPEKSGRRKSMKVGDAKVFDTEIMYARAMALQAGSRSLNINFFLFLFFFILFFFRGTIAHPMASLLNKAHT